VAPTSENETGEPASAVEASGLADSVPTIGVGHATGAPSELVPANASCAGSDNDPNGAAAKLGDVINPGAACVTVGVDTTSAAPTTPTATTPEIRPRKEPKR
jgi:hypothetical protein